MTELSGPAARRQARRQAAISQAKLTFSSADREVSRLLEAEANNVTLTSDPNHRAQVDFWEAEHRKAIDGLVTLGVLPP